MQFPQLQTASAWRIWRKNALNITTFPELTTRAARCGGLGIHHTSTWSRFYSRDSAMMLNLRASWQGGGGSQEGEVTRLSIQSYSLSFRFDHVYMIGGVTIWEIIWIGGLPQLAGFPPPPFKQALNMSKVDYTRDQGPVSTCFSKVPGITGPWELFCSHTISRF